MLKGLQCIVGRFRTKAAILKFSRKRSAEHRGKTYAHALTSAFPVCTCCLAAFQLEKRTTNIKQVCITDPFGLQLYMQTIACCNNWTWKCSLDLLRDTIRVAAFTSISKPFVSSGSSLLLIYSFFSICCLDNYKINFIKVTFMSTVKTLESIRCLSILCSVRYYEFSNEQCSLAKSIHDSNLQHNVSFNFLTFICYADNYRLFVKMFGLEKFTINFLFGSKMNLSFSLGHLI